MRKLLLTGLTLSLFLTACTKEVLVEVPVETIVEVPVEVIKEIEVGAPTTVPHGYPFSLTQFGDKEISNVVAFKETAGSALYNKLDYRERGELNDLIDNGYVALENNSCCLDAINVIVVVGFKDQGADHAKQTFNYIVTK